MNRKTPRIIFLTAVPLAALVLGGCNTAGEAPGETFWSDGDVHSIQRIADVQIARAARNDGMLYATHFSGDDLNSLGRQKVASMLQANDTAGPVVVYLSLGEIDDAALNGRRASVESYLAARGLREGDWRIENGINPNSASPAADSIAGMAKTDCDSPNASGSINSGGMSSGMSGGK